MSILPSRGTEVLAELVEAQAKHNEWGGTAATAIRLNKAWSEARALLATQRSTEPAVRGDARLLIKEYLDALATELTAWDLDPPLDHVKKAHDRCIEWLAQRPEGKDET
jgi:hypothetical protein